MATLNALCTVMQQQQYPAVEALKAKLAKKQLKIERTSMEAEDLRCYRRSYRLAGRYELLEEVERNHDRVLLWRQTYLPSVTDPRPGMAVYYGGGRSRWRITKVVKCPFRNPPITVEMESITEEVRDHDGTWVPEVITVDPRSMLFERIYLDGEQAFVLDDE